MSRRRIFKNIPIEKKTLDYLDHLRIGYVSKSSDRRISEKHRHDFGLKLRASNRPTGAVAAKRKGSYPFNLGPKKILGPINVKIWDNIPNIGSCPEVAVIGRSNAGKSTLLNSLLGYDSSYTKKSSVSQKPGETQALHIYMLRKQFNSKVPALALVDMPGYGFSFASEAEALRCFSLCSHYLRERGRNLKRLLLVLDARHGLKRTDLVCLRALMSGTIPTENVDSEDPSAEFDVAFEKAKKGASNATWKMQIVLTKCDLVERAVLARRMTSIRDQLDTIFIGQDLPIMAVAPLEGLGISELQKELAALVPTDGVIIQDKNK